MSTTILRCRRCQTELAGDATQCPCCLTLLKANIHLGNFNGYDIQLYLSYDDEGLQVAALRAILAQFEEQATALKEIREVVARTIYTTPAEALKGMADILHIIDGPAT